MSEWEERKINSLCKRICSGGTPMSTNHQFYGGSIPWLRTNEVDFCRIEDTEIKITQKGLDSSSAQWIPKNTVIVAMYGATAAKSAIAKIRLTTNQACCNLIIDESMADYRFIFYALKLAYEPLRLLAVGGAQQNLNSATIRNFKVCAPDLPVQTRIADILSAYDDAIENSNRRIALLEKAAQELYKEWFVRFRFPGHENTKFINGLPEDWEYKSVGVIAYVNPSLYTTENKNEEILYIDIASVKNGRLDSYTQLLFSEAPSRARRKIKAFDTIYSTVRPNLRAYRFIVSCPSNAVVSTGFSVVRSKNSFDSLFIYHTLTEDKAVEYFSQIATGTSYPAIVGKDIKRHKVLLPAESLREKFWEMISPFYKEIDKLEYQSQNLARQRDLLLPRLMSGKLEV